MSDAYTTSQTTLSESLKLAKKEFLRHLHSKMVGFLKHKDRTYGQKSCCCCCLLLPAASGL